LPLDVVDAPYRDLGKPLLMYLRRITADRRRSQWSSCRSSSSAAPTGCSTTSALCT
jgi:hypothetical protein